MKSIAVIGSSGGNLYRQGGNDPKALLKEIKTQAGSAEVEIGFIEFIGASRTMDGISMDAPAALWTLQNGEMAPGETKKLGEVNEDAEKADVELAKLITDGKIDGLVLMSCDPIKVNKASLTVAAEKKIPAVGTGGTSMAETQKMGVNVISASGTTGTTNRTRAVAFLSAFAKEWKIKYSPIIGSSAASGQSAADSGNVWKRVNFRGIMMASLPGFIAMAFTLALSKIPGLSSLEDVFNLLIEIIPVIVAAIAAKQISGLEEVGIVAGVVAGYMAKDGGLIGGMVAGILAGVFSYYIIMFCLKHKVPGTTANIFSGGLGGLAAGLIGMYLLAPVALWAGNGINDLIAAALAYSPVLAGALAGFLIWPAIIGGVYHAAILPIVMLEMESTGYSFLGAIDMVGLVMVSAGITLANVIFPRQKSDSTAALPGFLINVLFGTFVEASYPFMFSSKLVFATALISAAVSGTFVGLLGVKGTAYVPAVMAPFMANAGHAGGMAICMAIATGLAFVLTALANKFETRKQSEKKEEEK
jgi:fructose-specific phosphotransferase system IIC component